MTMYSTASIADFKGPGLAERFRNVMHPLRWFRRRMLRKPGSTLALALAGVLGAGIMVNALALQTERHPAPMFTSLAEPQFTAAVETPLPPARPQANDRRAEPVAAPAAPVKQAKAAPQPEAPAKAVNPKDQMLAIIKQGAEPVAAEAPNRTLLVQKALNRAGYGPLKEDGAFGPGTKQALERFETDRKLPVRGEASGRTLRELSRASGLSIE